MLQALLEKRQPNNVDAAIDRSQPFYNMVTTLSFILIFSFSCRMYLITCSRLCWT